MTNAPAPDRRDQLVELVVDEQVAAFLASLYGPDWRQHIPHPQRQETER